MMKVYVWYLGIACIFMLNPLSLYVIDKTGNMDVYERFFCLLLSPLTVALTALVFMQHSKKLILPCLILLLLCGNSVFTTTEYKKAENLESTAEVIYPAVVMDIAACTEYSDMANKIKQYQQEGKIGSYARYAQLSKPEINYLAIYNKAGKVVAVLTPGDSRINVKTQKADRISNYSGCGAIGFTVK